MLFDSSTVLLYFTNIIQMSMILFLLIPFSDFVRLAKNIKEYQTNVMKNDLTRTLGILYILIIFGYGITKPMRILNHYKISKGAKQAETPQEKLQRIIQTTYATRNYLLAGFSLFFTLVTWRLFDFIIFSAKLYEFSQLMSNYHVIDLSCIQDSSEPRRSIISNDNFEFEEEENESGNMKWPSVIQLDKQDTKTLESFFQTDETKSLKGETENERTAKDVIDDVEDTNNKITEQIVENSTNAPEKLDNKGQQTS